MSIRVRVKCGFDTNSICGVRVRNRASYRVRVRVRVLAEHGHPRGVASEDFDVSLQDERGSRLGIVTKNMRLPCL